MKIGITTVQHGTSFGSNLQAFALQEYLKSRFAAQIEFIDYLSEDAEKQIKGLSRSKGLKAMLKNIRDAKARKLYQNKLAKFESFAAKHYKRSERFRTLAEVQKAQFDYDVYMTGSDQVFRVNKPDEAWKVNYLSFAPAGKPRIAYAASFGDEVIPDVRKDEVRKLLREFSTISCREEVGSELIAKETGIEPQVVCDPVFLFDREYWQALGRCPESVKGEYILVYSLLSKEYMGELIDKVAALTGMKVVVIDAHFPSSYSKYQVFYDIDPLEFLGLFANASFVITNSFHGTSFSTIFRKDFFTYRVKAKGFITRAQCLLERFGLGERIVDESDPIDKEKLRVDYFSANPVIESFVSGSKKFLELSLQRQGADK